MPFSPPEDLLNPRIEPTSPALVDGFLTTQSLGMPLLAVSEKQIKTAVRHHDIPIQMSKKSTVMISNAGMDDEKQITHTSQVGTENGTAILEVSLAVS